MPYQKKATNRSPPFYRSEMVGRILVDISTEYVVTLAMSQNPDAVCLSGLFSSEDAQWSASLQNLRDLPLRIFRVLLLSNSQVNFLPHRQSLMSVYASEILPNWNFLVEDLSPIILLWEDVVNITVRKTWQIIYVLVRPIFWFCFL